MATKFNLPIPKSIQKLEELGFDPIEKLVTFYNQLEMDIYHLTHTEDDKPRAKFSQMAYVQLLNIQRQVNADLLRYKYARVPETTEVVGNNGGPLVVVLDQDNVTDLAGEDS